MVHAVQPEPGDGVSEKHLQYRSVHPDHRARRFRPGSGQFRREQPAFGSGCAARKQPDLAPASGFGETGFKRLLPFGVGVHVEVGVVHEDHPFRPVGFRFRQQRPDRGAVVQPDVVREIPRQHLVEKDQVHAENPQPLENPEVEIAVGPPHDQVLHAARGHAHRDLQLLGPGVRLRDAEHQQRIQLPAAAADRRDEPAGKFVRQRGDQPDALQRPRVGAEGVGHAGAVRTAAHDDPRRFELVVGAAHRDPAGAGVFGVLPFRGKPVTGGVFPGEDLPGQCGAHLFGQALHAHSLRSSRLMISS